jgi:hypothetical protein
VTRGQGSPAPSQHASLLAVAVAEAAAAIERLAGDLAVAEEPARFVALLEVEPDRD